MRRDGILVPIVPTRPQQVLPFAALAQWTDGCRLWQGQAAGSDPFQTFTYAAASGFGTPVGTGVTLMPFFHPVDAVLRARTMAAATGHSVVLGLGAGATSLQRSLLGSPYSSQLGAVGDYVRIARGLLDGEHVDHESEFFTCRYTMPVVPGPEVRIGLGVLRPKMAELAGEVADVAITWLTPASYLADEIVPALRRGAERAGRPVPRLVAIVPVATAVPSRRAHDLVLASNAGHLRLPHYQAMLRRAGVAVDADTAPKDAAQALVDSGAFVFGDLDELRARTAELADAGVDEVVWNTVGVASLEGPTAAVGELERVIEGAAA